MEILGNRKEKNYSLKIIAYLGSILIHIAAAFLILFFPQISSNKNLNIPSIDVTLLDPILPDSPDSDFSGFGKQKQTTSKLEDPSEAELKRLKRKSKNTKKKSDEKEFTMKRGFLPGGKGITKGNIQLETNSFPYMYYLSMLRNRISENWIPPFGSVIAGESKKVVISFWIDRKGHVTNINIESSSGDKLLDQSALRAVIVSNPFPPLPEAYPEASLGIHFGFICEL